MKLKEKRTENIRARIPKRLKGYIQAMVTQYDTTETEVINDALECYFKNKESSKAPKVKKQIKKLKEELREIDDPSERARKLFRDF